MPEPDALKPQLVMARPDLDGLPEVDVPDGYRLSTYQPGDGKFWGWIISESFGHDDLEHYQFDKTMRPDPAFRPERVFVILHDDEAVATASAWCAPDGPPGAGVLHYVGARNAHRGRKLGYQVSLAALHRMRDEGRTTARLLTDDFRLPAIKTYLKLGFEPLLVDENQRCRWADVFDALGMPELKEKFKAILDGPLWEPAKTVPDDFDYKTTVHARRRWHAGRRSGRIGRGDIDAFGDESLYKPSELGAAGASIGDVSAAEEQPFELWFRCGPRGLLAGTEVIFHAPGQCPLGTRTQVSDPGKPGFVEVIGGAAKALGGPGFRLTGPLAEGDEVRLSIGREGGFKWTPLAGRKEMKVIVDVGQGEPLMRLPEPVVIRVLPHQADHVDVFLPGTATPGESVRATVTVRDEFDNRAAVSEDENPSHTTVTMPAEPLVVEADGGRSNWCLPAEGMNLYFGDLHAHDLNSSAEGFTVDLYRWALEDKRLDFLAVPCQVHAWLDNDRWAVAKTLCEAFLDEGRFVTFLSFEWQHSHYGDKVVHYLGNDAPYLPIDDGRYSTPAKLYEALRGSDALIVSHHPGYALDQHVPGTDWDAMETDVDRLVELWSMHGSSEGYDPADRPMPGPRREEGVMAGLRQGLRIGFAGGSDTHSARPGGSAKEPRPYWGGLCAIWAEQLTRRSLFEALLARRTYALTGARIALKFTVNGAPMGAEIPRAESRALTAEAWAPGEISKIELMRDGQVMHTVGPSSDTAKVEYEDVREEPAFYHCRVTMANGHLAVCSPVWVG
jgi:mycothiol synthase